MVKTRAMATKEKELLASRGIPSEEEIKSLRDKFSPTEKVRNIRKPKRRSEVHGNRKVTEAMAKRVYEMRMDLNLSYA